MSDYPKDRPETIEDVNKGHICGKVTEVTQHNSVWLRDALDIALAENESLREKRYIALNNYGLPKDSDSTQQKPSEQECNDTTD